MSTRADREALEILGANASGDELEETVLSLIFQEHYLDPESVRRSPDNLSSCVCGEWSEGEMEPGWDDHLAEVAITAGFRRLPVVETETESIQRVRDLHRPRTIQVLTGACSVEDCDHEEPEDCPLSPFEQCVECDRIADEVSSYYSETGVGVTAWPCPTITALDPVPELIPGTSEALAGLTIRKETES